MVIHNIWIFTKKSGISLCAKKYGSVEVDESLFSGFLSSINTLAESEFDQKGVESINMGNYKFMYEGFSGVVFTVAGDPTDSDAELKNFLIDARKEFFEQFSPIPWENHLKELAKSGNVEHFEDFKFQLDLLVKAFGERRQRELKDKKILIDIYDNLINIFFLKIMAFSEVLDDDFATPLSKVIKDIIKNIEGLDKISIAWDGISFSSVELEKIDVDILKATLHKILEKLIIEGYSLIGQKPINKIITQLNPSLSMKLDEIRDLGICYPILQLLLKSTY
ncbi:MAG: hypothetical protein EAX96_14915 [Candidatus Lokiarchaeota archaeon]|nr:hypothetical protein [Candidatus Lokiarchaeota archaeon]